MLTAKRIGLDRSVEIFNFYKLLSQITGIENARPDI